MLIASFCAFNIPALHSLSTGAAAASVHNSFQNVGARSAFLAVPAYTGKLCHGLMLKHSGLPFEWTSLGTCAALPIPEISSA